MCASTAPLTGRCRDAGAARAALHPQELQFGQVGGRSAALGRFDGSRLSIIEVRRFPNTPIADAGTLRWDVHALWSEIHRAVADTRDVTTSIGVDAWGCDYALLDERGDLVERPYHYRDHRTDDAMASAFALVPRDEIYRTTGIQFLPFNTLFQLWAHVHEGRFPERATRLLFMPDLVHALLCESDSAELTIASRPGAGTTVRITVPACVPTGRKAVCLTAFRPVGDSSFLCAC